MTTIVFNIEPSTWEQHLGVKSLPHNFTPTIQQIHVHVTLGFTEYGKFKLSTPS